MKLTNTANGASTDVKTQSIDIPIELKWEMGISDNFDLFLGAGPSFSFLVDEDNWGTSCNRKYKIEGSSSVTSLDGKMLFLKTLRDGQWVNAVSYTHLDVYKRQVLQGRYQSCGAGDTHEIESRH